MGSFRDITYKTHTNIYIYIERERERERERRHAIIQWKCLVPKYSIPISKLE